AITAQNNFDPIPPSAARAVARTPGVEAIASVRGGNGRAFGKTIQVTAVEPETPKVMALDWKAGSQSVLGSLGSSGAVVDDGYAKRHRLALGSPLELLTPRGRTLHLVVR